MHGRTNNWHFELTTGEIVRTYSLCFFFPIDFENLYQQSISCITAETTDQCSLPGLELQVFHVFVILVGKR